MMTLSSKGYFELQESPDYCLVHILSCSPARAINKNRTGLVDDVINVDMKKLIVQNVIIINDNFSIIRYYLSRKFIISYADKIMCYDIVQYCFERIGKYFNDS